MADLSSNNERMGGKKQFSVIKSNSETQRNWSNFFPISGVTVYLKYLMDNNLSYIKVGKTLGGDLQDESVQIFSPTTQGTIEAVAYFNEISHNQDKKDNPPPPQPEDGENVVSLEDLIKNILEQMMEGELDFTELEQQMQGTQPPDNGQGGEPTDEEGQNPTPQGGEPTDEEGQNPFPQGGEPTDEEGQNPTPQGGEPTDEEGQNPFPQGGEPTDEEGQNPILNGGTPVGQPNPSDIIQAVEDSFNIDRGNLRDIINTKERVMRRINLYNESELQQIASSANITGSRGEIITQINQALNTIYNG
jgi:hypothetical protein